MAQAPAHRFGQIIGDLLEAAVNPILSEFAQSHNLYLDKKGPRPARKGSLVRWIDLSDNKHDLDFVLEREGSDSQIGIPVAFIETAWRRYTKHSKNKVQEIQGAILPLVARYQAFSPFIGAILAGEFTKGALTQLKSLGFTVLYFPYGTIREALSRVSIDAHFDEGTPDDELELKVNHWKAVPADQQRVVAEALIEINAVEVQKFMATLELAVARWIESVSVLPLHGKAFDWLSLEEAIHFVESYDESIQLNMLVRYEIEMRYNNGDIVKGSFKDKEGAIQFLRTYQRPMPSRIE